VYIGIVVLVPAMGAAWARFGMKLFWPLTAAAIVVDVMYFAIGLRWLGFANYALVWGRSSCSGTVGSTIGFPGAKRSSSAPVWALPPYPC